MPYFVADGGSPENAAKLPIRSALAGNPVRQVGHTPSLFESYQCMTWKLPDPINGVGLTIEPDGLWLRKASGGISDLKELRDGQANNRLGRLLPSLIPQLIE